MLLPLTPCTMKTSIVILFLSGLCYFSESKVSLQFSNSLPPLKYTFDLKEVFASLFFSKTVCIWTTRVFDQRVGNLYTEIHSFHNYSVTHITYGEDHIGLTHCTDNVVFNFENIHSHVIYKEVKPTLHHVFLIIDTMEIDFEETQKLNNDLKYSLFKVFGIARVVLLTERQIHQLSSPFFPPRHIQEVLSLTDLEVEKVTDLKGRVVNIATFNCSLFSILRGPMNSGAHDGIEMRIMQQLAVYLNMTPNYINAKGWGWMFDNGTWNGGLAGLLQDGRAEIGYCNIWNTVRYSRIVNLGPQWNQLYYTFMVPRPVMIHGYWMTIVALFHRAVWFLLIVTSILVTILFWKYKISLPHNSLSDLVESVLTVFGTFLGQSTHLPPCYAVGQRIILGWSIFSFFMAAILNNTMISRLMVPHLSDKIDSIKDLVLGGYLWGEEAFSNFQKEIYFNLEDPWHKRMESLFQPIPRHLMKSALRSRKFAIPVQRLGKEYVFIVLSSINQSEINDFRLMRETINQFYVSIVFSKLSPMLEICRVPILRFVEAGLIVHWKDEVIRNYGSTEAARLLVDPPSEAWSEFEPLTIHNNLAAFKMLLIGWCWSLVVLLFELFISKKLTGRKLKPKGKHRDEPFTPYFYCE